MKPKTIRPGDKVRIINPVLVKRCGYPKCVEDFLPDARELAEKIGFGPDFYDRYHIVNKIVREIAYGLLHKARFGGRERTLHTEEAPHLKGEEGYVTDIKRAVTGVYEPACGGWNSYTGESDYEPACLMNPKQHRLAVININGVFPEQMIETCNLEVVENEESSD